MRNSVRAISFLLVTLLIAGALLAQSQATTGVIEGTVTDANGGVLPGVTITVRNTATNYVQTAVTDSDGRFRVVLLPLGPYEVTASLEGFAKSLQKGLDLGLGQTLTASFRLQQAAAEELMVTASAPLSETARTEGATRI